VPSAPHPLFFFFFPGEASFTPCFSLEEIMQFSRSFAVLLASVVIAISAYNVEALPAKRNAGMVTIPLRRLHQARNDIHPQLVSVNSTTVESSADRNNLYVAFTTTHKSGS
jgi:hypothetical protein